MLRTTNRKCREGCRKMQEKQPESTPILQSYTLSYTRNSLYLLKVLATGVGNVGDFQKLFLKRETVVGPEDGKHRTSSGKSTDV